MLHGTDKGRAHGYTTEVYPRYLDQIRYLPVVFLEIGLLHGASARMWMEYFMHEKSQFFTWDVNPDHKQHLPEGMAFNLVDCYDTEAVEVAASRLPKLDVVVDDGMHKWEPIMNNLKHLWPKLAAGGLYFIEDIGGRSGVHKAVLAFLGS